MSQSTPINLLRRNGDVSSTPTFSMDNIDLPNKQQMGSQMGLQMGSPMNPSYQSQSSESQLVEDILKEMGDSPGMEQQSNINSQALQYAMDSSQVPAYKYAGQNEKLEPVQPYNNYSEKIIHQQQNQNSGFLSQIGINLNGESLKDKIVKNSRYPILIFVISFFISLPEFNRFLFGFFPRLLLESGQVSIGGVLLKAFVGMLLFSIIALFL
jgi:hypothetical protein